MVVEVMGALIVAALMSAVSSVIWVTRSNS
jgi:hypothetical protein